jgi:hypothetical protein
MATQSVVTVGGYAFWASRRRSAIATHAKTPQVVVFETKLKDGRYVAQPLEPTVTVVLLHAAALRARPI